MSDQPKKYGLQLPIKKNVFQYEDDEDEDAKYTTKGKQPQLQKTDHISDYLKHKQNTQLEKTIKGALEDDPTAFDYDEVYDSMKNENKPKTSALQLRGNNSVRKPTQIYNESKPQSKYIASLVESANKKKKELERLKEKQIQKEKDQDADKYKDKDSYITDSYKEKLERDKRERELELESERKEELNSNKLSISSFQKNLFNDIYNDNSNSNNKNICNDNSNSNNNDKINEKLKNLKNDSSNNNKKDYYKNDVYRDKNYKSNVKTINRNYNNTNEKEAPQSQQKRKNIFIPRRNNEKSIQEAKDRYFERKSKRE